MSRALQEGMVSSRAKARMTRFAVTTYERRSRHLPGKALRLRCANRATRLPCRRAAAGACAAGTPRRDIFTLLGYEQPPRSNADAIGDGDRIDREAGGEQRMKPGGRLSSRLANSGKLDHASTGYRGHPRRALNVHLVPVPQARPSPRSGCAPASSTRPRFATYTAPSR
jgi:hypothetical protein